MLSKNRVKSARLGAALAVSAALVAGLVCAAPASAVPATAPALAIVGSVSAPNGGDEYATVPTMVMDASHHTLFALEQGHGHSSISVIDTTSGTVTGTLDLPGLPAVPIGLDGDLTRGLLYLTMIDINAGTSSLWVIDPATAQHAGTIPLGAFGLAGSNGTSGIGVDTATGSVFVAGQLSQGGAATPALQALSAAQIADAVNGAAVTPTVVTLPDANQSVRAVQVDSAGGLVYAAGEGLWDSSLYVLDAATNALTASVPLTGGPESLAVDPTTGTAYVGQHQPTGFGIAVVPRGASTPTATIALPAQAMSLDVDPNAGTLYAALAEPYEGGAVNELLAIRTSTTTIVAKAALPAPADVAVDTTSGVVYVSGAQSGNTTIQEIRLLQSGRVFGADRYTTSVAVSQREFPGTAPVVFIASGANFPDALSAGPAAAKGGGPLLLTTPGGLTAEVAAEVTRLNPTKIVVVGGPDSVSDAVLGQLRSAASGATVSREAGSDRFLTSRTVVSQAFTTADTVYLASGANFPDALAAGGAAGAQGAPLLLVNGYAGAVDAPTAALLASLKAKNVELVGGTAVLSAGIATSLAQKGYTVGRLAGSDRYATAQAVDEHAYTHATTALLATGFGYPDALSATTLAATTSAPLYLAPGGCVPRGVLADLARLGVGTVTLIGGPSVLSAEVSSLTACSW